MGAALPRVCLCHNGPQSHAGYGSTYQSADARFRVLYLVAWPVICVPRIADSCRVAAGLVRIFRPDGSILFRNPRGLRFGPDGDLDCVARDEVVSFDFERGDFSGAIVNSSDLFGQAIEFFG
jgi:hypothetical protein